VRFSWRACRALARVMALPRRRAVLQSSMSRLSKLSISCSVRNSRHFGKRTSTMLIHPQTRGIPPAPPLPATPLQRYSASRLPRSSCTLWGRFTAGQRGQASASRYRKARGTIPRLVRPHMAYTSLRGFRRCRSAPMSVAVASATSRPAANQQAALKTVNTFSPPLYARQRYQFRVSPLHRP